jgi:mannose-6-phosphate isomerase-like protein (cupin superfamily)
MSDVPTATPLRGATLLPPGANLAIAEWESPAGETLWIAPLHIHHQSDEAWYVLEGRMILHLAGKETLLGPGDCGMAVRGTAHAYRNAGPGPLRYLLVMPRQIAGLVTALHAGPRDETALDALFREHESTYLGWLPGPE